MSSKPIETDGGTHQYTPGTHPTTREAEARRPGSQGQPHLHTGFETRLSLKDSVSKEVKTNRVWSCMLPVPALRRQKYISVSSKSAWFTSQGYIMRRNKNNKIDVSNYNFVLEHYNSNIFIP